MTLVRQPTRSAVAIGRALAWTIVSMVVVEPCRQGRLGLASLPPSLRRLATVALGMIWITLGVVAASGLLPTVLPTTGTDLGVSYPRGTAQFVAFGIITALALIFTATIHLHRAIGLICWVTVSLIVFLATSAAYYYRPFLIVVPTLTAAALLVVLLNRHRHRFALGEFAVVILVLSTGCSVNWLSYQLLNPGGPAYIVSVLVRFLLPFITPFACLAGLALAEVATSFATGTVAAVHVVQPRLRWLPVLIVLGAASLVRGLWSPPGWRDLAWSGLLVVVAGAGWMLLARRPRLTSNTRESAYDPETLWTSARRGVWGLALVCCVPFLISGVATILGIVVPPFLGPRAGERLLSLSVLLGGEFGNEVRYVAVIGASVVAVGWWRRTRPVLAQVAGVVAVLALMLLLDSIRLPAQSGWSIQGVTSWTSLAILGLAIVLIRRGQLTRNGAIALSGALALGLVFPLRDALADPVTAVIGSGLVSVLLLSVTWQLLTEGEPTRHHSAAFPREARVLFFLGYQLLWAVTAAVLALTRDPRFGDIVIAIDLGDRLLGTTLLLVSTFALVTVALHDTSNPPPPGPQECSFYSENSQGGT